MQPNLVKQKLTRGEACRGVWVTIPSPFSARGLARLPLDWLMIDGEHSPIDVFTMAQMLAAINEAGGPAPLVRVAQASAENLKHALDNGAFGVVAPMINTRAEAEQVVGWSKFPPQGQRSFGSFYSGRALGMEAREYLRTANQHTISGIQIESKEALEHLDEILSVPGLDLAFVGPVDLSLSLGLDPLPENPHPLFLEALAAIQAAAQRHGVPLGIFCSNGAAAAKRIAQGFLFVNVISDMACLMRGVGAELEVSHAKTY